MIRIDGTIREVQAVENTIKQGTVWVAMPFRANLKHDGGINGDVQGKEFKSKRWARTYDVFGDVSKVKDTSPEWLQRFAVWWTEEEVSIQFVYDERTGAAHIDVTNKSWRRITKIIPSLKDSVEVVRKNYGRILAHA